MPGEPASPLPTHHDVAHGSLLLLAVGADDDVDVLHDALEGLVEVLGLQLQLQQGAVHLVHHQDGLDPLGDGLAQHGLGLHTHPWAERERTG